MPKPGHAVESPDSYGRWQRASDLGFARGLNLELTDAH